MAGRRTMNPPAALETTAATYSFAPRLSVIAFKVHAKVRIRIAGTIALNPSGIHAMDSENFSTFRTA